MFRKTYLYTQVSEQNLLTCRLVKLIKILNSDYQKTWIKYNVKLLINSFASCVLICTLGFLSMTSGKNVENLQYLFSVTNMTVQIYLVSFLGDKLSAAVFNFYF